MTCTVCDRCRSDAGGYHFCGIQGRYIDRERAVEIRGPLAVREHVVRKAPCIDTCASYGPEFLPKKNSVAHTIVIIPGYARKNCVNAFDACVAVSSTEKLGVRYESSSSIEACPSVGRTRVRHQQTVVQHAFLYDGGGCCSSNITSAFTY